jgi:hypothetical protein
MWANRGLQQEPDAIVRLSPVSVYPTRCDSSLVVACSKALTLAHVERETSARVQEPIDVEAGRVPPRTRGPDRHRLVGERRIEYKNACLELSPNLLIALSKSGPAGEPRRQRITIASRGVRAGHVARGQSVPTLTRDPVVPTGAPSNERCSRSGRPRAE